jgi:hypothetical protein
VKFHTWVDLLIINQVKDSIIIPLQVISSLDLMTLQLIIPVTYKHLSMRAHSIDARDKPNKMRPRPLIFLDDPLKKASFSFNELSYIPLCKMI